MMMRGELPRNAGTDGDGTAQIEADHFDICPVRSQGFDMRDLAQVAEHVHDDREIELLEESRPYPHVGGCKPGEISHSFIRDAVSSWLIFLSSPSFTGPGGSLAACASRRAFSAAIRSSNVRETDLRCMTQPRAYGS
jgi:hypothetical protein